MSVDTREKRFSMLNFGDGSHIHATFEVDGAVDLDDRQHLLDCYSGIAFGATVIVTFTGRNNAPVLLAQRVVRSRPGSLQRRR